MLAGKQDAAETHMTELYCKNKRPDGEMIDGQAQTAEERWRRQRRQSQQAQYET